MTLSESNQYYQNPEPVEMELVFSETGQADITITNEQICSEQMSLEESLCSDEQLMFGACESSCFKVRIVNSGSFEGKTLTVTQKISQSYVNLIDSDNNEILDHDGENIVVANRSGTDTDVPFGIFKVFSDKPSNDRMWRDLVCYDAMYDILNADVTEWFSGLTFPMTIKDLRDSFFEELGIDQVSTTLINDSYVTQGGFVSDNLAGKTIIEAICELNACFGHITRDGKFEYICLPTSDTVTLGFYKDGTGTYEDYTTDVITGVVARSEASDVGTGVGTSVNPLIIENNPLVYGDEGKQTLATALTNILNALSTFSYRPYTIQTYGNPCLPIGTNIVINTKKYDAEQGYQPFTINSIVKSRVLTGIQGMMDSLSATGKKDRGSEVNSLQSQVNRTMGKIHRLTIDVERFESEVEDAFEQTNTKIEQTASEIEMAVTGLNETFAYQCETTTGITVTWLVSVDNFLSDEEYEDLIGYLVGYLTPVDYFNPNDYTDKYLLRTYASGSSIMMELYQSVYNSTDDAYVWELKRRDSTSSYQEVPSLTIREETTTAFADIVPEESENLTLNVTLKEIWTQENTNIYLIRLRLPALTGRTNERYCRYPVFYHGEPITDLSVFEVDKSYYMELIPYSDISSERNTYGFKYVFNVLDDIKSWSSSQFQMLKDRIVLSVNSSGKVVAVELGIDPSTQTSLFQVTADNISFISNGKIELTSNSLEINSTHFKVSSTGQIEATSGKIADWNIDANSLYKLTGTEGHSTTYSKTLLKPSEIRFYENNPNTIGEMSIQVNSQGFFHYSYDGSSWIKDFAIDFHQVGLQAPDVNRINSLTGASDFWAHTQEISLNGAIESIEPYFRTGIYTFAASCFGYLTSGGTALGIHIPLRMLNGMKITAIGKLLIRLRKPSGGYIASDGEDVTLLITSKAVSDAQGEIQIVVTNNNGWGEPNNIPFTGIVELTNLLFDYA